MSTLVSDALTELAYRFGEDSSPSNAAEAARRLSFISKANLEVFKRHMWWWTEKDGDPIASLADTEIYDLPSDYRHMIEVKVNGVVYHPLTQKQASEFLNPQPYFNGLPYGIGTSYYYIFADKLHIVPKTSANAAAISATITRSGQVATVTCTAHGFSNQDYITIAGAAQSEYNGNFYITVIDANTFSYVVTGSPATPATGTITAQKKAIRLKYYQKGAKLTATTQAILIPDEYATCLDAFAYGRICQIDDERGSASDGFDEFDEIMKQMMVEQNKRIFWGNSVGPDSMSN